MLARRFTIVCLLAALFGMGLSTLVAQTSRQPRGWAASGAASCAVACGPQRPLL